MLVLQNFLQFILMRFARASTSPEDQYSSAAAVISQELIKTVLSFAAVIAWEAGSLKEAIRLMYQSTVIHRLDFLKLAVPGLLYTIQVRVRRGKSSESGMHIIWRYIFGLLDFHCDRITWCTLP